MRLLLAVALSVVLGCLSAFVTVNDHKGPPLPLQSVVLVYMLKIIHILLGVFLGFYVFLFPTRTTYDVVFLILYFGMVGHWLLLKDECILSYLEAKVLDPSYILGSQPRNQEGSYGGKAVMTVLNFLFFLNMVVVIWRSKLRGPIWTLLAVAGICFGASQSNHTRLIAK